MKQTISIKTAIYNIWCSVSNYFENLLGIDYEAQELFNKQVLANFQKDVKFINQQIYFASMYDFGHKYDFLENLKKCVDNLSVKYGKYIDTTETELALLKSIEEKQAI